MSSGAEAGQHGRRTRALIGLGILAGVVLVPVLIAAGLWLTNPRPGEAPGWSELAAMPAARGEVAAATLARPGAGAGELYVAGGFTSIAATSDRVSVYRYPSDRWEELPPLPEGRHHAGAAIADGDLYVTGGASGALSRDPSSSAWVLREGAASWEEIEPMPEGRYAHRVAALGGELLVVGGEGPSARVLAYTPGDGWEARARMPAPRHHLAAVARAGEVWAIGGRDGDDRPLADVHVYDPARDRWREGPALPEPVSAAAEGVIEGEIHLVGGEDPSVLGGGVIDDHLVLPRGASSWRRLDVPPLAVHGAAGGVIDGGLVVAGGAARQGLLSALAWTDYAARFDPRVISSTAPRGG